MIFGYFKNMKNLIDRISTTYDVDNKVAKEILASAVERYLLESPEHFDMESFLKERFGIMGENYVIQLSEFIKDEML